MTGEKRSVCGRRDMHNRAGGSTSGSEDGFDALSPEEREFLNSKMFLMTQYSPEGPSLYEHLANLITKILEDKPENPLKLFEDISYFLKLDRIHIPTVTLRDHVPVTHAQTVATAQWDMFKNQKSLTDELENTIVDEGEARFEGIPNTMRQALFFEMAGVGVPREEFYRISLSLAELLDLHPSIQSIRFWGKILGTFKNYYVIETEFGEDDYEEDVSDNEVDADDMLTSASGLREEDSSLFDDIILPEDLKSMYKPPPKIPCEAAGSGLNKKVYFVASEPGLPWIRLPHVTPAQIQTAKKIRKLLTGDLNAQVISYPPFPGVEKNFLRTQIARISASTHVSPIGYFRFDDEGDEEEEHAEETGSGRDSIIVDTEFDGHAVRDLADGSLQAWVHHTQAILPQGRTTWWNPVQPKEAFNDDESGEEEDEERNEPDEPEPEVGPPLLTPLAEDESVGGCPPWIASTSSKFVPEYGIAVMQSNVWIGAMAFAADKGKFFENIYIGWGLKNLGHCFEPALPDEPMPEFPSGPEITETDDPTPEEEAAIRAAQQEKELEAEFNENVDDDDDDDIVDDDGEGGDQFDED